MSLSSHDAARSAQSTENRWCRPGASQPLAAALPLAGYRVLDLTRALVGPYCTMLLGDLGADVIKIERPETGDEARHWGPPFYGGESSYFLSMNRNKRSVALDLKDATGLRLCLQLAAQADIVIENFRPGVADRLGVGYEAVRAVRPDVVYCSISAYGQDGPDAWKPGYDLIMQGEAGMMSVTGHPDGTPVKAGVAETDILAGTNALAALLGALLARERSEHAGSEPAAQYIDVGLLEGQVSLLGYHLVGTLLSGKLPGRMGNALPYIVPYQVFETGDVRDHHSGEQRPALAAFLPRRRAAAPRRRSALCDERRPGAPPRPAFARAGSLVQDAAGRRVAGAVGAGGRALWPDQYDGPRGSASAGAGAWTGARAGPSHRPGAYHRAALALRPAGRPRRWPGIAAATAAVARPAHRGRAG